MKQSQHNKYKTILADPPWDINQKGKRGAARHYPLMTLDQIKAMPVADLCEENAHLYLWVPNGLLPEGLEVIEKEAFLQTGIRRITIPASVKVIEAFAFWGCRNLEQVDLRCGSRAAETCAFYRCPGLRLRRWGRSCRLSSSSGSRAWTRWACRTNWRSRMAISGSRRLRVPRARCAGESPGP